MTMIVQARAHSTLAVLLPYGNHTGRWSRPLATFTASSIYCFYLMFVALPVSALPSWIAEQQQSQSQSQSQGCYVGKHASLVLPESLRNAFSVNVNVNANANASVDSTGDNNLPVDNSSESFDAIADAVVRLLNNQQVEMYRSMLVSTSKGRKVSPVEPLLDDEVVTLSGEAFLALLSEEDSRVGPMHRVAMSDDQQSWDCLEYASAVFDDDVILDTLKAMRRYIESESNIYGQHVMPPPFQCTLDNRLLEKAESKSDTSILEALIENGANCNVRSKFKRGLQVGVYEVGGQTPLRCAVLAGALANAKLLITHGADINAVDDIGKSISDLLLEVWALAVGTPKTTQWQEMYILLHPSNSVPVLPVLQSKEDVRFLQSADKARMWAMGMAVIEQGRMERAVYLRAELESIDSRSAVPASLVQSRIVFLVGWQTKFDSNWYIHAARELHAKTGLPCVLPYVDFPNDNGKDSVWVRHALEVLKVCPNDILVAHSKGANCALRLCEAMGVKGIALVGAGWSEEEIQQDRLAREGAKDAVLDESEVILPINFDKIVANMQGAHIRHFHGTDDSIIPAYTARNIAADFASANETSGDIGRVEYSYQEVEELGHAMEKTCPLIVNAVLELIATFKEGS